MAYICLCGILITIIVVNINIYLDKKKVLGTSIDLDKEKSFWETVIIQNPNYKDAYLEIGSIYKDQGNKEKADKYFKKAIKINPNSQETFEIINKLTR